MSLAIDISADSKLFDHGFTLTLHQLRAGTDNPITVPNCNVGPLTYQDKAALSNSIETTGGERLWILDGNSINSGAIDGVLPGDIVDDGTNTFSVISAILVALGNRWRCVTRLQEQTQE